MPSNRLLTLLPLLFAAFALVSAQDSEHFIEEKPALVVNYNYGNGRIHSLKAYASASNSRLRLPAHCAKLTYFTDGDPRIVPISEKERLTFFQNTVSVHVRMLDDSQATALAEDAVVQSGCAAIRPEKQILRVPLQFMDANMVFYHEGKRYTLQGSATKLDLDPVPIKFEVIDHEAFILLQANPLIDFRLTVTWGFKWNTMSPQHTFIFSNIIRTNAQLKEQLFGGAEAVIVDRDQLVTLQSRFQEQQRTIEIFNRDADPLGVQAPKEDIGRNYARDLRMLQPTYAPLPQALKELSSFNIQHDLRPDELYKEASSLVELSEDLRTVRLKDSHNLQNEAERSVKGSASISGGGVNFFTAEVRGAYDELTKTKGSTITASELESHLNSKQNGDVKWSWEGKKLVPKTLKVYKIHKLDFETQLEVEHLIISSKTNLHTQTTTLTTAEPLVTIEKGVKQELQLMKKDLEELRIEVGKLAACCADHRPQVDELRRQVQELQSTVQTDLLPVTKNLVDRGFLKLGILTHHRIVEACPEKLLTASDPHYWCGCKFGTMVEYGIKYSGGVLHQHGPNAQLPHGFWATGSGVTVSGTLLCNQHI